MKTAITTSSRRATRTAAVMTTVKGEPAVRQKSERNPTMAAVNTDMSARTVNLIEFT